MTSVAVRAAVISLLLLGGGCIHLGTPIERIDLPPGTPRVEDILADLAANDAKLEGFRAAGTFSLVSPDRPGMDRFRQSSIMFRRPSDLHVVGRKLALPTPLFRLTCVGSEFLIEFPTEKQYYYRIEGDRFESVPFSVSPSDVADEMFFPEPWSELPPKHVRITGYDETQQTVTIEILESGFVRTWVRRRLTVQGLPWVVILSKRLDKQGNLIAVTEKSDYHELDGIRFPAKIDVDFPLEKTKMSFDMRNIQPNVPLDDEVFDIKAIHDRVQTLGHESVDY
jgi:hypothetical protein